VRPGHRTTGTGPGLIIVPGALALAKDFDHLATALAARFTVHTIERRGRGARPSQGHRAQLRTGTWFDPLFRPEPPHANQAYGICFTEAGMIVLGACDTDGGRFSAR